MGRLPPCRPQRSLCVTKAVETGVRRFHLGVCFNLVSAFVFAGALTEALKEALGKPREWESFDLGKKLKGVKCSLFELFGVRHWPPTLAVRAAPVSVGRVRGVIGFPRCKKR